MLIKLTTIEGTFIVFHIDNIVHIMPWLDGTDGYTLRLAGMDDINIYLTSEQAEKIVRFRDPYVLPGNVILKID